MANPFVGYLANVAGRTVAGVGSAIYGALTDSKEAQTPARTFDDYVRDVKSLKTPKSSRGRKAASSAEKSN